jgi:hypothetical protein
MRRLLTIIVVWCVALLAGCIKMDEKLMLKRDGAGTLAMSYAMSEQTIRQMQMMQTMAEEMGKKSSEQSGKEKQDAPSAGKSSVQSDLEFDEAKVRQKFKKYEAQGVHLDDVQSETRNGWRYMHLKVHFDNLAGLARTDLYDDRKLSLTKNPDGNYRLAFGYGEGKEDAPETPDSPQMEQMMAAMMAGLHVATSVTVPGGILQTNAHQRNHNTASWDYDIDKDPKAMSKMKKEAPYVVFAGNGLELPHIAPTAPSGSGSSP